MSKITLPFVIISAMSDKNTHKENLNAHESLLMELMGRAHRETFTPVIGKFRNVTEMGFAITPIDFEFVKTQLRRFNQNSALMIDEGKTAYFVDRDGGESRGGVWTVTEPELAIELPAWTLLNGKYYTIK